MFGATIYLGKEVVELTLELLAALLITIIVVFLVIPKPQTGFVDRLRKK